MSKFKTLVFKNPVDEIWKYATPINLEEEMTFYLGRIPKLMLHTTTLEDLKRLYPTLDFDIVELVEVELTNI